MFDVWRAVQWWEEWQLRILVLGSLTIQWFLLVAAPMRKYTVPRFFRKCIWLAYVSSDALAIYALATLFNRHAKATTSNGCGGIASKESILEILWAPILLIHLGGQEELTAYTIEDNELWTRHTVTLVSQVAVALYAFYKSWPTSSDWKLLTSAILLFIIGVISFSEKPWALNQARINRLATVSATIQGTKKRSDWGVYFDDLLFSDWYNCFTKSTSNEKSGHWFTNCFTGRSGGREHQEVLSEGDRVFMILSDMSLMAAADDLEHRGKAKKEDILQYMGPRALAGLQRWLRGAFGFIYTRANVVVHPAYLTYHLLVVPALHITALTLFATSEKHVYNRTDVKVTYILMCFTAALDVLAVFIRQLLYWVLSKADVPALCETVPGYNLVDAALRRAQKDIGWLVKCATKLGCKEEEFFDCRGAGEDYTLYKAVSAMVMTDLVQAQGRDLARYRTFTVPHQVPAEVIHDEITELAVPQQVPVGPDEVIHDEITELAVPQQVPMEPIEVTHDEITELPEMSLWRSQPPSNKIGGAGGGMEESISSAALSEKTTGDEAETRITISSGTSSFITEHNTDRPAAPRSDEQLQHACWHHTMEPQQPARVVHEKLRINWALSEELQKVCGPEIRGSLRGSFDRSVLVWHIATDLCFRVDPDHLRPPSAAAPSPRPGGCCPRKRAADPEPEDEDLEWLFMESAEAISNYMAHLLNSHPDMLLTGSRQHLVTEAMREIKYILKEVGNYSGQALSPEDAGKIIEKGRHKEKEVGPPKNKTGSHDEHEESFFHVPEACKLAYELLHLPVDAETRWKLIYRVWLGMLFYSASMCRGYLHAKSLGEGGEFLSFVWLFLSLRGAKTLADKLQMLEADDI